MVWGWFCAQEGDGDPGARLARPLHFPGWRRVLKQRGGGAEELLTRLPHSGILRRPLRSPRLRSTSFSAAGSWRAGALSGLKRLRLESALPLPPPRRMSVCRRNDCVCARVISYTSSGRSQPDRAAPAPRSAGTSSPDLESDLLPGRLSPPPPARLWSSSALMGLHFLPPTPLGVVLFFPDGLRVLPVSKKPREPTLVGAEGGDSRL